MVVGGVGGGPDAGAGASLGKGDAATLAVKGGGDFGAAFGAAFGVDVAFGWGDVGGDVGADDAACSASDSSRACQDPLTGDLPASLGWRGGITSS